MDLSDWTISRCTDDSNYSYAIGNYVFVGGIGGTGFSLVKGSAIRPTFYLNSNVNYISGEGSKNDPIKLS